MENIIICDEDIEQMKEKGHIECEGEETGAKITIKYEKEIED